MTDILNTVLYQPIEATTIFLYHLFGDNIGLAIIALTIIIKLVLLPLSLPALKSSQKVQNMQEELKEIKARYKNDKQKLQEEQLKLYKKHGINPLGGCLPLLLTLPILFILWKVLNTVLAQPGINGGFLWLNLSQPDPYYILPVLAGIFQFIQSKMMAPPKVAKQASKSVIEAKDADKKGSEDLTDSLASAMQTQNLYFMPALWVFMLWRLPAGLGLYLIVTIIFGIIQQIFMKRSLAMPVQSAVK